MADNNTKIVISAVDQTQAALRSAQLGMEKLAGTVGLLGVNMGALVGLGSLAGFAASINSQISSMAKLDDLAEKTGATVENLSALSKVAKISGRDFGEVENGLVRLAKALAGADDEAKGAGHALETLGLKAGELKNLDTGEAMLRVAKAFDEFADKGPGKAALAMDLFGRSGAQLLPFLKDLAEQGELVGRVTAEQAAAAEQYEKNINRLSASFGELSKSLAAEALPALNKFVEQLLVGKTIAGGWVSAMWEFGVLLDPAKGLPKNLADTRIELEKLHKEMAAGMARNLQDGGQTDLSDTDQRIKLLQRRLEFLKLLQRQELDAMTGPKYFDARDYQARQKKSLDGYQSKVGQDKAAVVKQVRDPEDYQARINSAVAGAVNQSAVVKARELQDTIEALDKLFFDAGLDAEIYASALDKLTGKTSEANEAQARLNALLGATPTAKLEEAQRDMQLLATSLEQGSITEAQFIEAAQTRLGTLGEKVEEVDSFARDMGMSFSSAFEEAVLGGKKLSDVINGLAMDVGRIVLRKTLTEPIGNAVSGFIQENKPFSSLFGGGRASGGPVNPGQFYVVGENGPEILVPGVGGTVIPRSQGGGGGWGAPIVNIIEDSSRGGQIQQRNDGRQNVLDVFVDRVKSAIAGDISRGSGAVPMALESTYGMNRAVGGY